MLFIQYMILFMCCVPGLRLLTIYQYTYCRCFKSFHILSTRLVERNRYLSAPKTSFCILHVPGFCHRVWTKTVSNVHTLLSDRTGELSIVLCASLFNSCLISTHCIHDLFMNNYRWLINHSYMILQTQIIIYYKLYNHFISKQCWKLPL